MASQFDELRLQVTFVDNASAQLKAIKGALDELGGPSHAQNLERLKKHTSEVDEALKKMIETISKGPKGFLELAEKVSIAGVSFGTFLLAADKTKEALGEVTEKLVELGHVSILTGVEPARIKAIEEAYERHGVATKTASKEVTGFAGALDDFSRASSAVRNQLYADFPKENEVLRQMVYGPIDRAPDIIAKFNAMKKGAHDVREYFTKRGDEALGRMLEADILKRFQAPNAAVVTEMVEPVDDAMTKLVKTQVEKMEEYENVTKRIKQNWEDIATYMKIGLMDSGLMTALKWIDGFLEKWSKYAAAKPATAAEPPKSSAIGGSGETPDIVTRFGGRRSPGASTARPYPSFPPMSEFLKPGPNAIEVPQTRSIAPLLSQPTTGYEAMPRSQNIEDRRGEWRDRDEQTTKLTTEIRRLNALLSGEEKPLGQQYGMLSPAGAPLGGGGYGGGGVTPGGTQPDGRIAPPGAPGRGGQMVGGGLSTGGAGAHVEGGAGPIGPTTGGNLQGNRLEAAKAMVAELRAQGMSEAGIAGIMANVASESNFDPTSREADQPRFSGEAHFAHGLYQEGGDEWNNYSAWLRKNYPQGDWRDPTLQTRFMAERMKTGAGFGARKDYQDAWRQMQQGSKEEAAQTFVSRYLKPAERYRQQRMAQYRRGVPTVEQRIGTPTAGPTSVSGGAGVVSAPHTGRSSAELDRYLEYAGLQTGLRVDVAHGLEPGHARHTAAAPSYDLDLYDAATNRKLDMRDPKDLARYQQFVYEAVRGGATGVGAGKVTPGDPNVPYMGPHRIHIGGGTQVAWGAGGASAKAPGWLKESLERGSHERLTPQELDARVSELRKQQQQAATVAPSTTEASSVPSPSSAAPDRESQRRQALAILDDVEQKQRDMREFQRQQILGHIGNIERTREAQRQEALQILDNMEQGRKTIDQANAPRKVDGTGNINVKVENVKPRGRQGILKRVDMPVHSSGDKAASGHPAPPAATGGEHEAGMAVG